jgi:NAD(P)-dependent dehydrogenase (short-subunit alcohol dehydrogenase family)
MSSSIFRQGILDGQVAVVTGGGTGIGASISRELAHLGATVVIASRKRENIEPAAAGLSEQVGREVFGDVCDIRDREAVAGFVGRTVEQHGRIDLLVNNGGGQFFAPAETITPNGWDAVINTNLTGTWNMTRAVGDAWMFANGGRVVNITMLTKRTFTGMAHSHASRAGVEAMTRTLAIEWAQKGILLNCIAPGLIASSGFKKYPMGMEWLVNTMIPTIPLKKLGSCDDIAWMVAFLASPAGSYITGQTLTVDGGRELWGDYWPIPDPPPEENFELPSEPWEK